MAERAETLEKKPSRLFREIAEMASAQRRLGIMVEASYEKKGDTLDHTTYFSVITGMIRMELTTFLIVEAQHERTQFTN